MMMIPFQVSESEYSVFVIMEAENVERMKANDPAQINLWKMPKEYETLRLRDVIIATPSEEDVAQAIALMRSDKMPQALQLLSRGFKVMPGDVDRPYDSMMGKPS